MSDKANEAFDFVLRKIEELKEEEGIRVEVSEKDYEGWDDVRDSLREKYKGDENRVNPRKWRIVSFYTEDDEEKAKVHEAANDLFDIGISFDTGMGLGSYDWQMDWSFRIHGESAEDKKEMNNIIKDLKEMIT